jgi:phosphatidylserine/phosphatidylglycerophosphate/cardiolipin synthase-like enzyme
VKQLFLIIVLQLLTTNLSYANEVYFSPSEQCENKIIDLIDNSLKTIDVAVYSINNIAISESLIKAYERGVDVRIITDRVQAKGRSSKVPYLLENKLNLVINNQFKIEHNKFAIFDGEILETGSFNWTEPASKYNSENCLFIDSDKKIISNYQGRFNELWKLYN